MILVTLTLPVFFSILGVVVDGSNLMVQRRVLQNAVDAAVLAASQDLPADGSVCAGPDTDPTKCLYKVRHDAETFSSKNGGPSSLPSPTPSPTG